MLHVARVAGLLYVHRGHAQGCQVLRDAILVANSASCSKGVAVLPSCVCTRASWVTNSACSVNSRGVWLELVLLMLALGEKALIRGTRAKLDLHTIKEVVAQAAQQPNNTELHTAEYARICTYMPNYAFMGCAEGQERQGILFDPQPSINQVGVFCLTHFCATWQNSAMASWWEVARAASARSKCRGCKQSIANGAWRLGVSSEQQDHGGGSGFGGWYHLENGCWLRARTWASTPPLNTSADLRGFDHLSSALQSKVTALLAGTAAPAPPPTQIEPSQVTSCTEQLPHDLLTLMWWSTPCV